MPSFDINDIQTDNGHDQEGAHDESNDAKRRRIARVRIFKHWSIVQRH